MGRLTRTLLCLWVAAVAGAIANMALMVPVVLAHSMGWLTAKSVALPVAVVTMTLCAVCGFAAAVSAYRWMWRRLASSDAGYAEGVQRSQGENCMKRKWKKFPWWRLLGAAAVVLGVVNLRDAPPEPVIFTLVLVFGVALPYALFKWVEYFRYRREHGTVPWETREPASTVHE